MGPGPGFRRTSQVDGQAQPDPFLAWPLSWVDLRSPPFNKGLWLNRRRLLYYLFKQGV